MWTEPNLRNISPCDIPRRWQLSDRNRSDRIMVSSPDRNLKSLTLTSSRLSLMRHLLTSSSTRLCHWRSWVYASFLATNGLATTDAVKQAHAQPDDIKGRQPDSALRISLSKITYSQIRQGHAEKFRAKQCKLLGHRRELPDSTEHFLWICWRLRLRKV